ncbi:hypothetical protein L2E82_44885 [Cichorium intybus]|uniref:Uncharacterized protein n=1 Tax=Cichorium intybus TaxID=13427 RepID=A0ACB8ZSS8_CICIN|nr:hypothetical protein L2E82_44885 [Cichorium intybus]
MFSHLVLWEEGKTGIFYIVPRKGDTWTLFKNWNINWSNDGIGKYEYSLSRFYRIMRIALVLKLRIWKSWPNWYLFGQKEGEMVIPEGDKYIFSHMVPSCRMSREEWEGVPKGCYELASADVRLLVIREQYLQTSISVGLVVIRKALTGSFCKNIKSKIRHLSKTANSPKNKVSEKHTSLFVFEFLQHQADRWRQQQGYQQQNLLRNLLPAWWQHWLPDPPHSAAAFLPAQVFTNKWQRNAHHVPAVPLDLFKEPYNFALQQKQRMGFRTNIKDYFFSYNDEK